MRRSRTHGRLLRVVAIGTVAAIIALVSLAVGGEEDVPAWKKPAPGTRAFLGDDGGGVDTATVCSTVDEYRSWLDDEHPRGCKSFQHGLPVVIETVIFDPAKDTEPIGYNNLRVPVVVGLPIVKVRIPTTRFTGYLRLDELQPVIPPGTVIQFKVSGTNTLKLFPNGNTQDHAIELGDHVTVKVITYEPSLHVTIIDGEHAGQSGWMSSFLVADANDGVLIDQFSQAIVSSAGLGAAAGFNCHDVVPHSGASDNGNFVAAFKELEPLANARCPEAEHLLGVMYAEGRGVQKDVAHAFALLLLAYSDGVTPVGKKVFVPVVGDDENALEIVQFGAQLTSEQLDLAEGMATKFAQKRGRFASAETASSLTVMNSAKELRPLIAGYKLNGELATIELPDVATPLSLGMNAAEPGHVLTQLVTDQNARIIPFQLLAIQMRLRAAAFGTLGSDDELKRTVELAESQGESFAWLKSGASVRVAKFYVNAGFAAQVELVDEEDLVAAKQRYWVDSCFLVMKDARGQALWQIAKAEQCAR